MGAGGVFRMTSFLAIAEADVAAEPYVRRRPGLTDRAYASIMD